jgi:hypothetical protein
MFIWLLNRTAAKNDDTGFSIRSAKIFVSVNAAILGGALSEMSGQVGGAWFYANLAAPPDRYQL